MEVVMKDDFFGGRVALLKAQSLLVLVHFF